MRSGGEAPDVEPTVPCPHEAGGAPWGYRHKVHFVFSEQGGALVLGHFIRRSTAVLPVTECPVHAADGNRLAFALRDAFGKARIPKGRVRSAERDAAPRGGADRCQHP